MPEAAPCPADDVLAGFAEDALEDAERASIAAHVTVCVACAEVVAHMRDTFEGDVRVVGRYEVVRELGRGGMGIVYEARDPVLGRRVAVKVLRPRDDGATSVADEERRLLREARAMARVAHPNVVTVYDAGTDDGRVFLAMALVRGPSLRAHFAAHPALGDRERIGLLADAGRGLAAAHAASVVHRDFKPENVIVGAGGAHVTDFGLARPAPAFADEAPTSADARWLADPATRSAHGTPAYMSPEQIDGRLDVGPASDQFSLAVATWEAAYRVHPFGLWTKSAPATMRDLREAMDRGPLDPPSRRSVPAGVHAALVRALSADPAARFPSVASFVDALDAALSDEPAEPAKRLASALYAMFGVHAAIGSFTLLALGMDGSSDEAMGAAEWAFGVAMFASLGAAPIAFVAAKTVARRSMFAIAFVVGYVVVGCASVVGLPVAIWAATMLRDPRLRSRLGADVFTPAARDATTKKLAA